MTQRSNPQRSKLWSSPLVGERFVGLTHEEITDPLRLCDRRNFGAVFHEPVRGVLAHEALLVRLRSARK